MSNHYQSAHYASVHFLSYHFSGGTAQVITVPVSEDAGADGFLELQRLPNGHIIAIAAGTLIILEDDLEY